MFTNFTSDTTRFFYFHDWFILLSLQPPDYPQCHIWHCILFFKVERSILCVCMCTHTHFSLPAFLLMGIWFHPWLLYRSHHTHKSGHSPLRQGFISFRSTIRCGSYGSLIFNDLKICLTIFHSLNNGVPDFPLLPTHISSPLDNIYPDSLRG